MNARVDIDELNEWEAYYQLEPWGAPAEDDRWRQMFTLFWSAHDRSNSNQPDWLDRDPTETARLREAVSVADKMEAFFSSFAVEE